MTINLVTLGCSKNLVDSEKLLFQLECNGHEVYHEAEEYTDAVIINTCGFILDAKTESIETILHYAKSKQEGFIDTLIVMGCLSQRYRKSLTEEIPEVDAFFGVDEFPGIMQYLRSHYEAGDLTRRVQQDPGHYAYLKISEGCNRNCAFCSIPGIRGKLNSIPVENLMEEAVNLAGKGVKELILIAQELTSYGIDLYGRKMLPELLEKLVEIDGIDWIRLHYIYPDGFPVEDIIRIMKENPKICRYLDIPVQHASNKILKKMKRSHNRETVQHIIDRFREEIPDISIRTSVITGFPGESEDDFNLLKDFVSETAFDRMGVFTYSHEEDTPAYSMQDDVPGEIKEKRKEELMAIQTRISLDKNHKKIGKQFKVLVDRKEGEFFVGRTEFDSPEIDNEVLIPAEEIKLQSGRFYTVEIFDAIEFDLYGRVISA